MSKLNKMHGLVILFILLILVLVVRPSLIKNIYSSFLGRIFLVVVVFFFAMNNRTLGLLTALVFILFSNTIFVQEGMDSMEPETETKDKVKPNAIPSTTTTSSPPIATLDLETIKNSLQAKASSTLPVANTSSTENVEPATQEAFQSMHGSF